MAGDGDGSSQGRNCCSVLRVGILRPAQQLFSLNKKKNNLFVFGRFVGGLVCLFFILGISVPIAPGCFVPLPVSSGEEVQVGASRARFIIKNTSTCLSQSPSGCHGTS